MTTDLYESKETNDLAGILSKVTRELASPFILYSNYRRDLSEGKRNIRLNYLTRKSQLGYEMKLNVYEQELERKLQEPEISEKIFGAMNKGIQYLRKNYDWEKEKKQAKAIGRGTWGATKGVAKGTRWAGKRTLGATKYIAEKVEWIGRKAWSEILAKDRAMSKRRYLNEAYKEENRRQKTQRRTKIKKEYEEVLRENERRKI